jgi:hypothetical protein
MKWVENAYDFDHGFPHTFLSGTLMAEHGTVRHKGVNGPGDIGLLKQTGDYDWVEAPKGYQTSLRSGGHLKLWLK